MNTQDSSTSDSGIFLPVLLIAASLLVFFIWQAINVSEQRSAFNSTRAQLEEQFKTSTPQQNEMIKQSVAVQAKLEKIASDLLDLAKDGDPDAKAIIAKYNISKQAPTGSPSPAPESK